MLRQFHIFQDEQLLFTHSYAIGLANEDIDRVKNVLISVPMPGKTFQRPVADFQIFHHKVGTIDYCFIADMIDSISYIDKSLQNVISKFKELFPNPKDIKESSEIKTEFINYLSQVQKELHSKIALVGPIGAGKTTLYNMIKSGEERAIMNFAKSATLEISNLHFDLWDMQLNDNYTLLWTKFIGGSDLLILMIDASNYNLKILDHFLNLQNREGRMSKSLVIANKTDLVDDEAIRILKNELENDDIKALSLNDSGARSEIYRLITESLGLKKVLPSNFGDMIKEAEKLELENNTVGAIAKYKELINICNTYQDFLYLKNFQLKLNVLNSKLEKQMEERRALERKKKFEPPDKIKFAQKVDVKTLPHVKAPPPPKPRSQPISPPEPSKREIKSEVDTIKAALTPTPKPPETAKKPEKLSLKATDIKIDLTHLQRKETLIKRFNEAKGIKSEVMTKEEERALHTPKVPETKPIRAEDLRTDSDFVNALHQLIQMQGSSLSLKLCAEFVEEMQSTLERPLSLQDLRTAAELFIKQENTE